MCHAWPCCDPAVFTVRLYAPDGTTRWIRNYSAPSETLVVPLRARLNPATGDVIVASVGGVNVTVDGVVVEHFNLRASAPDGTTRWRLAMPQTIGALGPVPVGVRDFDIDATGAIHVLTAPYVHAPSSPDPGQTIIRCSAEGVWLDPLPLPPNPAFEALGVTVRRAGPPDAHSWTGDETVNIVRPRRVFYLPTGRLAYAGEFPGIAEFLDERWPIAIYGDGYLVGPIHNAHTWVTPRGPGTLNDAEICFNVAGDAQGNVVYLGGPIWDASVGVTRGLGLYHDTSDLPLVWTRPGVYPGPLDVNPAGRIAVARTGSFGTAPGGNESRVASVVVLDSDGGLAWQHLHAQPLAISVGLDGAVAVCHGPAVLSDRSWDFLPETGV